MVPLRLLLEEEEGVHHEEAGDPHNLSDGTAPSVTQSLRIAAIFIIFAASILGSFPPILLGSRLGGKLSLLFKALGTGVILALGFVHCYTDTFHNLESTLSDPRANSAYPHYPLPGILVLGGALMMMFMDVAMRHYAHSYSATAVMVEKARAGGDVEKGASGHKHNHVHDHDHDHDHEHHHDHGHGHKHSHGGQVVGRPVTPEGHGHGEVCMHGTALVDACNGSTTWKCRFTAYLLEIGCVFHSIIIGVTLGMSTRYDSVVALVIALSFHQFLEGLALGTVVNSASFGRVRSLAMAATYSLTCPVGIAIGVGVLNTIGNSSSWEANIVQGVFNGVSAGILLYVGFSMAAEDLSREDVVRDGNLSAGMAACIFVSAFLMSLLAMWA